MIREAIATICAIVAFALTALLVGAGAEWLILRVGKVGED